MLASRPADSAVLRVPVLFGEVESVGESAVTALWPKVLQGATAGETCALDHCQQRFPTHTQDVAAVCWNICRAAARVPSQSFFLIVGRGHRCHASFWRR